MDVPRFVECTAESTRGLESPLWPLPHHLFIPGDSPATETRGGSLVLGWSCPGVLSPSEVVCVFHQGAVWCLWTGFSSPGFNSRG